MELMKVKRKGVNVICGHFEYQWALIGTQRDAGRRPSLLAADFQCVDFVTCRGAGFMHDFAHGNV